MLITKPQVNPHLSLEGAMESAEVVKSKKDVTYIFLCHVKVITMTTGSNIQIIMVAFLRRF